MDLTTLTDDDLAALIRDAYAEERRRATIQAAPVEAATLATQYAEAIGREDGDEWQAPTGAHNAYPQGATVTHDGKTWESLTPANVWAPGIYGWRELTADGDAPPEWVAPSGAHDAYGMGDEVTHGGKRWRSEHAANAWAPPTLWADLGPA